MRWKGVISKCFVVGYSVDLGRLKSIWKEASRESALGGARGFFWKFGDFSPPLTATTVETKAKTPNDERRRLIGFGEKLGKGESELKKNEGK